VVFRVSQKIEARYEQACNKLGTRGAKGFLRGAQNV